MEYLFENLIQLKFHRNEGHLSCFDLGKIENIINDLQQGICRLLDHRQIFPLIGG